ncbi:hypothetical protein SKAU_G00345300 [Synaphobranchus kaupii]|uniref:Sperm-associated antigen 17 n=1 Tax=Synaphobranchus kaupii TaxID=118154 RepID=A0A9Q1EJE4_SYNKA|nr:hypothetical protein SKAU_G00345300 [Synaphobranchus kaupii]
MPPKRVKSGTAPGPAAASGNKTWESGLVAAPFEEESWKADISLVVGARLEDEDSIKALVLAVQLPARKLFAVITWDATLEKIHELGNPKNKKAKDVPAFSEVMESAKAVLDAGEELPSHLLGKVVKFQLLVAKGNDLQRRTMEQRGPEDKAKGKTRAGSPSKEKGGAATKAAGKGEKGKKAPEPPTPAKETKLKRRGEGEEISKCTDDEPAGGPQLYVLIVGFLQPQLVAVLDTLGIRISNVIRVSAASSSVPETIQNEPENSSEPALGSSPTPQDQERAEESERVRVRAQLARFWKYLDPVLSSGPPRSRLWDVSRLQYTMPEELPRPDSDNTQAMLAFGMRVFGGVACLIYECLDWRKQHLHYLSRLRLIQVPAVTRGNELSRQESQASVRADPQTPLSKRRPVPDEPAAVEPPVVTLECDMRHYRDLLDLFPPETVSVPLILHCLREQVVVTQEQIPPPSAARPKPRIHGLDPSLADHMISAALSLGLSEEEKEKLLVDFGVQEEFGQQKKEPQYPLLFNSHDERSRRLQQLSVHCGLDPVQVEVEMLRSGPLWRSLRCTQPESEDRRRLAKAQELLHFCTDETLSWAEVEWAFRQFVFESMHLRQVEGRGLEMGVEQQAPPIIPWDDPASFIRQIRMRANQNTEDHANREEESKNEQTGSELNKVEEGAGLQASRVDITDIRGKWVRSLRDWNFAESHDPNVFPQVLQDACENYSSIDMLHGVQDKAVFVVCHNPMSPQRQRRELWDMALHTDVGFRKYLAHVAESISDWTNQEEERRLALQGEREAERLNTPTPSEHSAVSRKRSRGSPKRSIASPVKSPCPEESPARELHIRQDSLKAWKMEQDRQKEEEVMKKSKKEKERKGGSKERSPSSRASKKTPSATRRKKEEVLNSPEPAAPPLSGRSEPQLPVDEPRGFTGYCMQGELIQACGSEQSLFPSDGGHIRVERTEFIQGSIMVTVCVMKDKHQLFTHITEPRREDEVKDDDIITVRQGGEQSKMDVGKFGSFSALLENGIRLSYSHHGPTGETAEVKDPTLASVLDIHPPPTPSPPPSSATSRSPSGKRRKAHSSKGSRSKGRTTPPAPVPPERDGATPPSTQEGKEKPVVSESSGAPPDQPPLQCLNACTPHGLLVQFLSARVPDENAETQGVMVRQSFPALGRGMSRGAEHLLFPGRGRTRGAELTFSLEYSRLITSQGTVIKYMKDGSTGVLFADGAEEEVKGQRSEVKEPAEKKGKPSAAAMATVKIEGAEPSDSDRRADRGGAEQGGATQSHDRTWFTTAPSGLRVATTGNRVIQAPPFMACKATDPMTGTVMLTREDMVLTVLEEGGNITVEHSDGTRITTFYQDPLSPDHLQAGEEVVTVTRKQKLVRVECEGFVTVVMNCEEGACSAEFGEETVITAHPNGSYQVFPSAGGLLCIDEDGTVSYTSHPAHSATHTPAGQTPELQPGNYTMRHTNNIICELMDPEGTLFQVMVDGETSAVISSREDCLEEEREEDECEEEEEEEGDSERPRLLKFPSVGYKEPSPRFFVVHEDGSGIELLRSSDIMDFLCSAHSDPSVAVLKEPIPELQGVWDPGDGTHSPPQRGKRRDPPFGSTLGRGLCLKERPGPRPATPLLTCPEVLEVRQLIQYQPISSRLRRKLERRLQSYLEHLLEKEHLWEEMQVKEPRTEEEKVHATDLLQLVLSLPDTESPAESMQRRLSAVDVASLYTHTVSSALLPDCVTHSKGCEEEHADSCCEEEQESLWVSRLEQYRQELREAEQCLFALRNGDVPPYFTSDIYRAFVLTEEVPDMESLALELPPFPRQRENPDIQEFQRDALEPATRRPSNPTPSHAAGGDAPSRSNPTPQTAAPPCPPPASAVLYEGLPVTSSLGNSSTVRPQTEQHQTPMTTRLWDPIPEHSPQEHTCEPGESGEPGEPVCGSSSQRGADSQHSGSRHRAWELDVAGNPRKESIKLPSAILCAKPSCLPNQRFLLVEEPVRRKVRTASVRGSQSNGILLTPPRGFQLLPAEVDFGVLREGCTYCVMVIMKNVGVDSCRFSIKQPPPATGLKVRYTPGPVAAGMKADLQVELFAMATGPQDSEEEGPISYCIQIQTETEILYLPVALVGGGKVQVGGAKVRLVSSAPSVQRGVVRPHRRPQPSDEELPLVL